MVRIEILAIGESKIYSVGSIVVDKRGNVYFNDHAFGSDFHLSRHASGKTHWKSRKIPLYQPIREGIKIEDFKGIEFLTTTAFGIDSLPRLYTEYKISKNNNGVFAFDMREYKGSAFNMLPAILTEEGLSTLYNSWKRFKKGQIYLYTACHPMIAITIVDAKLDPK